jgi:hypothetical protein
MGRNGPLTGLRAPLSTQGWRGNEETTYEPPTAGFVTAPSHVTVDGYPTRKYATMPIDVLIVNIAVLFAVLEADLGRRKISTFRIMRPLLMAAGIIPLFVQHVATAGNGATLEIILTGLGVLLGRSQVRHQSAHELAV